MHSLLRVKKWVQLKAEQYPKEPLLPDSVKLYRKNRFKTFDPDDDVNLEINDPPLDYKFIKDGGSLPLDPSLGFGVELPDPVIDAVIFNGIINLITSTIDSKIFEKQLERFKKIEDYDISLMDESVQEVVKLIYSGKYILLKSRFIFVEDEYILSVDGRTGCIYQGLKMPTDILYKLISGISFGLIIGIGSGFLVKYIRNVLIEVFGANNRICIKIFYEESRFIWIMLYPKITGVINDDRLADAIKRD